MNDKYVSVKKYLSSTEDYRNYCPVFIFSKNSSKNAETIIYATDKETNENIIKIDFNKEIAVSTVNDWDFNIDDHFFFYLENEYQLCYMSLDAHHGIWNEISNYKTDDISNKNGLNEYIRYCSSIGITSKLFYETLGIDVMDINKIYPETNQRYKIIEKTAFNDEAVVIGYNKNNPSPYVTWIRDRNGYYYSGHYFQNIKGAFDDYKRRCNSILKKELRFQNIKYGINSHKMEH